MSTPITDVVTLAHRLQAPNTLSPQRVTLKMSVSENGHTKTKDEKRNYSYTGYKTN